MALREAIPLLIAYDLPGARRLLEKLREMGGHQAEFGFADASLKVIDALGLQDASAALALARQVEDNGYKAQALAHAAVFQPKENAVALFREAAREVPPSYSTGARLLSDIGVRAHAIDPAVGAEILRAAQERVQTRFESDDPEMRMWREQSGAEEVAAVAFALSRVDPVESRLLLETEFTYQNQIVPEQRRFGATRKLVLAMATLDFERALEMSWQIPSPDLSAQFGAQYWLAKFLLTPPEKRFELLSQD
jgi:hypothetical protein